MATVTIIDTNNYIIKKKKLTPACFKPDWPINRGYNNDIK